MLRPLDEGTLIQLHVVHNLKFVSHPGPGKIVPCARRKTPPWQAEKYHDKCFAPVCVVVGAKNPADRKECQLKRPGRTEDPTDGTHCLVNKTMSQRLVGKSE
jgi:hypothetical protein